jgi:hypothetical protein
MTLNTMKPQGTSGSWAEPRTLEQAQQDILKRAMTQTPPLTQPAKMFLESNPSRAHDPHAEAFFRVLVKTSKAEFIKMYPLEVKP